MRPLVSGAASGVVVGISAVLLLQQLGLLSLSDFATGVAYVLSAAIAAGTVFGVGGAWLGRSANRRAMAILAKDATAAPSTEDSDPGNSS